MVPSRRDVTALAPCEMKTAMTAFDELGDEVIVLEPCYESYTPSILFAGAIAQPVWLRPTHLRLEPARLAAAFSPRT